MRLWQSIGLEELRKAPVIDKVAVANAHDLQVACRERRLALPLVKKNADVVAAACHRRVLVLDSTVHLEGQGASVLSSCEKIDSEEVAQRCFERDLQLWRLVAKLDKPGAKKRFAPAFGKCVCVFQNPSGFCYAVGAGILVDEPEKLVSIREARAKRGICNGEGVWE